VSLAGELLKNFESRTASVALLPSDGGRFEVSVDGKPVYSKLGTGRHAEPGEISQLIEKILS
jgi:selenoprotein W-related protein